MKIKMKIKERKKNICNKEILYQLIIKNNKSLHPNKIISIIITIILILNYQILMKLKKIKIKKVMISIIVVEIFFFFFFNFIIYN